MVSIAIAPAVLVTKPRINDSLVAISVLSLITILQSILPLKKENCSLERWLMLRLEQETCRISLEHLVLPHSKGVCKEENGGMSKAHRGRLKDLTMAKVGTI